MASKRRLNYQWRLFIPLVALLWVLIASLVYFQYRREKATRTEIIRSHLTFINDRIIVAYENNTNLLPFLHFLSEYVNHGVYHDIRVSVYYTPNNQLIYSLGAPLPNEILESGQSIDDTPETKGLFFFTGKESKDGAVRSFTAMPYSVTIVDALTSDPDMWIISLVIAIFATVIAFITTRYLGRNIRMLRDFTTHAASDSDFISTTRFPNDELGEISQQIVNIYNKRSQALKDLEYEHRIALKATREKSRIKRELTNNINHELKTPIGIIKGYIDTILQNPDMEREQAFRFLEKASKNVDRLCEMLADLSTITRLEENGDHIPTEPLDFHEIVFTVADEINESNMAPTMKFVYDIPFDCYVRGNAQLLSGMILNLAKNAAAYSGGTEMGIKKVAETARFYTFSFYDNGSGVDDKHLPMLFDRFYRVDSGRSRKQGGTGLGLPIVKNTIVSLGGSITVNNRPEGGLEFNFTLPKETPP